VVRKTPRDTDDDALEKRTAEEMDDAWKKPTAMEQKSDVL